MLEHHAHHLPQPRVGLLGQPLLHHADGKSRIDDAHCCNPFDDGRVAISISARGVVESGAMGIPLTETAIVGIGQTEFSKNSGRSELQLAIEASKAAIEDAGLTPTDIEGMVTFDGDPNDELAIIRSLGIPELRWVSRTIRGGAGSGSCVHHAAAAVSSGAAKNVLVFRAFNERSGRRFGQPMGASANPAANWHIPYGLDTPAKIYSLWYQRYMDQYGVTNADFGRYTVAARKYAAKNPNAWFYNRPITLEDHQASRWIVEPILRLLDCCQESDGGVAMVISPLDRAKDGPNPPAKFLSLAQGWEKAGGAGLGYNEGDL